MRISNGIIKNNLINNIHRNYVNMERSQERLVTGQRNTTPGDNPIEAINSIYYRTRARQIEQYQKNINQTRGVIDHAHGAAENVVNVLQKIRELSLQAANGTLGRDERIAVAMEAEELLKEIVATGNMRYKDDYLFSGSRVKNASFRTSMTSHPEMPKPLISEVVYNGDNQALAREVDINEKMNIPLEGSGFFWADNHVILAMKDVKNYIAGQDSTVRIDGVDVNITAGDNLDAVIDKINKNTPSVTAYKRLLPDERTVIALEGNYPHKLQIQDLEGGSVMQDLGILRSGNEARYTENNIHPNTIQSGSSIFDVIIRFRNSLLENRTADLGGKDLGSISKALGNVVERQAAISAKMNRLNYLEKKMAQEQIYNTEQLSKNEDVDIAREATEFSTLQNVHKVSLMTGAKLIQPTLLDYLR